MQSETNLPVREVINPSKTTPTARVSPDSEPGRIVAWALERFANQRTIVTTQFGMEGCALIDMCARTRKPIEVVYLDTMFLFPETYALRDRLAQTYANITIINRGTELTPEQQTKQHGEALWEHNPDRCCRLRKVEPMARVMEDVDVWLTGLRRTQSATRANVQIIEWDWKYEVLKVNPLADWSRPQVWKYIQEHNVPYNPLHEHGYPTLGCTHCTKRVPGSSVTDYTRNGRWQGKGKTECGLHGDGI